MSGRTNKNMKIAEVTRIHPKKLSQDGVNHYIQIDFITEDGYARTYLVDEYLNQEKWQEVISGGRGTTISGYKTAVKDPRLINADSNIQITRSIWGKYF